MRRLEIAYLLQSTDRAWGGVQTVFREADALVAMGHDVTLYSKTDTPNPDRFAARIERVASFDRASLRPHDLVVGTFYPTVPAARLSGCGRPVHYCQGYEGDSARMAEDLLFVESVYQLDGMSHICVAPTLAQRLHQRFGIDPVVVPYGIDLDLYRPAKMRPPGGRLRVALVGPWEIEWKGIPTGVEAARLALAHGVDLELVRISPTPKTAAESTAWGRLPVEWHEQLTQAAMPAVYRSCDIFLGTTLGGAEAFFMPAMEAMACGLPVVLSDVWCFHDYDHGGTEFAMFAPPGDSTAFAAAIRALSESPAARHDWRARSLEVSRRHAFARHAAAMEQAFQGFVPPGQARSERGRSFDPELDLPSGRYRRWLADHSLTQQAVAAVAPTHAVDLIMARLELNPNSASAWNMLARAEFRAGNFAATLRAIDRYHELDPNGLTGLRLRGLLHLRQNDFAAAHRDLDEAIRRGHHGANIQLEFALALLGSGNLGAVDQTLAQAATQPFDQRSQALLAQIESAIGQLDAAPVA